MSYTKKIIKIYFWQVISIVLNFLSLFIVAPHLSGNKDLYGIFTICVSISIFLVYADLGFIGAGKKYAAEYFAKGELENEISLIGFSVFFLFIFLLIFSAFFLFLGFYPELLITSLKSGVEHNTASSLLIVLAIFTPTILFQQIASILFGIRLENYIVQKINILASLAKILSVFYFFRKEHYDIVGYFIFFQALNFCSSIVTMVIAKFRYGISIYKLIYSIRFNKNVFNKIKKLAFSSLFLTFAWIIYYEMDAPAIGKFLGANDVAIYAIGLSILTFFRTLLGVFYAPFSVRFNHLIGLNQLSQLKALYNDLVINSVTLVIIPILTITIFAKPIVLTWVGNNYSDAVPIVELLVLVNLFAFISYPTSMLLNSLLRLKELYLINTLLPIVFWCGVILTYNLIGLKAFGVFKIAAFYMTGLYSFYIYLSFLKLEPFSTIKRIIIPIILPILFVIICSKILVAHMPTTKSTLNLAFVGISMLLIIFIAWIVQYFIDKKFKFVVNKIFVFMPFGK